MGQRSLFVVKNPGGTDVMLENALAHAGAENPIRLFEDEKEARAGLLQERAGAQSQPALIFLQGSFSQEWFDLLQDLRQHPDIRCIPVIVVLPSEQSPLVGQCYQHGAHSVVLQDASVAVFNEKIQWLCRYWLTVCRLPSLV